MSSETIQWSETYDVAVAKFIEILAIYEFSLKMLGILLVYKSKTIWQDKFWIYIHCGIYCNS